eukprot:gene18898-25456_t
MYATEELMRSKPTARGCFDFDELNDALCFTPLPGPHLVSKCARPPHHPPCSYGQRRVALSSISSDDRAFTDKLSRAYMTLQKEMKRTNKRKGCMQNNGRRTDVKAHAKDLRKKKRTNAYRGRIQKRCRQIDMKAHANDLRDKRVAKLEEHFLEQIRNSQQYPSADSNVSSEACKSMSSKNRRLVKFCLGADQKPKKLGSGGFGDVFEGTYMGIKVALKVLKGMDKEEMLEDTDFSQEMASLAAITGQPNCMGCEGWFVMEMDGSVEGAELYQSVIVMEMMDEYLDNRMGAEKTRIGCYLHILSAVTHGLGQVHESGLFHNDIKGDNILIKEASVDGDGGHNLVVKISDMGLSSSKHAPPHNP